MRNYFYKTYCNLREYAYNKDIHAISRKYTNIWRGYTMQLLKATTTDGQTEYFNSNRILTLQPNEDGKRVKILMGAGLYWWVWADSITETNIYEFMGGMNK